MGLLWKCVSAIRFRTGEPDYTDIEDQEFDWTRTVYGNITEIKPYGIPKPKGNYVTTATSVDTNLHHDLATCKAITDILHLVNETPIDWYSKKQATVESVTYGSEFVAARTAVDQIIDLRATLMYLGVVIRPKKFHFWGQQVCGDKFNDSNIHFEQKASYFFLPPCHRSNCCKLHWVLLERLKSQPCYY